MSALLFIYERQHTWAHLQQLSFFVTSCSWSGIKHGWFHLKSLTKEHNKIYVLTILQKTERTLVWTVLCLNFNLEGVADVETTMERISFSVFFFFKLLWMPAVVKDIKPCLNQLPIILDIWNITPEKDICKYICNIYTNILYWDIWKSPYSFWVTFVSFKILMLYIQTDIHTDL